MKIRLYLSDNKDFANSIDIDDNGNLSVTLLNDKDNLYSKAIKNYNIIDIIIDDLKQVRTLYTYKGISKDKYLKELESINNLINEMYNGKDFYDLVDKIYINNDSIIDNKSLLKNKKLYLNENIDLSKEDFKNKTSKWLNSKDNLYVKLNNDSDFMKVDVVKDTIDKISDIVDLIKSHHLSPLEEDIYAYDIARSKVYKSEGKDEPYENSRDLSKVLKGDEIVCLGFANLYDAILTALGHKTRVFSLKKTDKDEAHAEVIEKIKDDKYNINGIFISDPTWDSKNNDNDMDYLNNYRYFNKTLTYMRNFYKFENLEDEFNLYNVNIIKHLNYLNNATDDIAHSIFKNIRKIKNFCEEDNLKDIAEETKLTCKPKNVAVNMSKEDLDKYKKSLKQLNNKLFSLEISPYKLFEAIIKVRKLEYYDNPSMYPYSNEDIRKIFEDDSKYSIKEDTSENRQFYYDLNGSMNYNINPTYINDEEYNLLEKDGNLNKEISRVKLTRTLKNILETKKNTK